MGEDRIIHPQEAAQTPAAETTFTKDSSQTEDAVMKTMLQYFADEMLPAFGITKKVKNYAPTEHVRIEIKKACRISTLSWKTTALPILNFKVQTVVDGTSEGSALMRQIPAISYKDLLLLMYYSPGKFIVP